MAQTYISAVRYTYVNDIVSVNVLSKLNTGELYYRAQGLSKLTTGKLYYLYKSLYTFFSISDALKAI